MIRDAAEGPIGGATVERRSFASPPPWNVMGTTGETLYRVLYLSLLLERITTADATILCVAKVDWGFEVFLPSVKATTFRVSFYSVDGSGSPVEACKVQQAFMFPNRPGEVVAIGGQSSMKPESYDEVSWFDYGFTNGTFSG